jgi:hypothetical protein
VLAIFHLFHHGELDDLPANFDLNVKFVGDEFHLFRVAELLAFAAGLLCQ